MEAKTTKKRNTVTLNISVSPELKAKIAELAEKDRRSISTYVSIMLERMIEGKCNG